MISSEIKLSRDLKLYYLESLNYQPVAIVKRDSRISLNISVRKKRTFHVTIQPGENLDKLFSNKCNKGDISTLEINKEELTIYSDLELILNSDSILIWNSDESLLSKTSKFQTPVELTLTYYEKPVIKLRFKASP